MKLRFILASSRSIKKLVEQGVFDATLYALFSDSEINLLPLRERKVDIPLITDNYLNIINQYLNTKITGYTDEFIVSLSSFTWPGNNEQLFSMLKAIAIRKQSGQLVPDDLPFLIRSFDREELLSEFKIWLDR